MLALSTWAWRRLCDVLSVQESGNGIRVPNQAGPLGRHRFFRRFSAHFCVTPEHLFFLKCQNVEEKSAENVRENLRKNLCAKNLHKNGRKNLRPKSLRKNGRKNLRQKLRTLEDGSQKRNTKTLRKICGKTPAASDTASSKPWSRANGCGTVVIKHMTKKHQLYLVLHEAVYSGRKVQNRWLRTYSENGHSCKPKWVVADWLSSRSGGWRSGIHAKWRLSRQAGPDKILKLKHLAHWLCDSFADVFAPVSFLLLSCWDE